MTPGTKLGPYEIVAPIGAGGMGEVYKARDTRLDRIVAIKTSKEQFTERFEREARSVAALNHPNICTLHDVGPNYLVMEYIEGPTLAERIHDGAIPPAEALPIARQIAEALEAAHEKGIIHRDLKPANIKLTPEGKVKVLDFGLAKAFDKDTGSTSDPANSPTLTISATRAGVILGTAGYMSPEQARGTTVDKRADIWSFGVVLLEMLTGRPTFPGETVSDTLAAVLKEEPNLAGVPVDVRPVLERCLRKDRRRRWRDIGDVLIALEEGMPAATPAVRPRRPVWPWPLLAGLAIVAAAVSSIHFSEKPLPPPDMARFSVAAPEKGSFTNWLSVSPDGQKLVFAAADPDGAVRLWLRPLDSVEARPLAGTGGTVAPFWSSDSRFIAFQSGGKLKKMDLAGGAAQTVCDLPNVLLGGSWNRDGTILLGSNSAALMRVSASGGPVSAVTTVDPSRQETFHADPTFLPDGRHFIYLRLSNVPGAGGVFLGSLDVKPENQSLKMLAATGFSPAYVPPAPGARNGYLLFLREGTLLAQPLDSDRLELVGDPVPVAEQVGTYLSRAFYSVSATGVFAWRTGSESSEVFWVDRDGRALGRVAVPGGSGSVEPSLSPDSSRMAYSPYSGPMGKSICLFDFARGAGSQLTFNADGGQNPIWSPDGAQIVFVDARSRSKLYRKASSGAGSEALLLESAAGIHPDDWSADGRFLLYSAIGAKGKQELWLLPDPGSDVPSGARKPIPFLQTGSNTAQGQFSPDGRWVAYRSDESGISQIYVRPFPPSSGRTGQWLISSGIGVQPRWRRDGKELFYVSPEGKLMAVEVAAGADFKTGPAHALFAALIPSSTLAIRYAVAENGKRFLLVGAATTGAAPITVVLNWQGGLRK